MTKRDLMDLGIEVYERYDPIDDVLYYKFDFESKNIEGVTHHLAAQVINLRINGFDGKYSKEEQLFDSVADKFTCIDEEMLISGELLSYGIELKRRDFDHEEGVVKYLLQRGNKSLPYQILKERHDELIVKHGGLGKDTYEGLVHIFTTFEKE